MARPRVQVAAVAVLIVVCGWTGFEVRSDAVHPEPDLINSCLITDDVGRLVQFYESILKVQAQRTGEDYAELHTGTGVLAIFSAKAQERYIPGSAVAGNNRGLVLEFRVADVDQEYGRLQGVVKVWVKAPTTQPWGTRSIYFRDPDGNLVDFFTPVKRP